MFTWPRVDYLPTPVRHETTPLTGPLNGRLMQSRRNLNDYTDIKALPLSGTKRILSHIYIHPYTDKLGYYKLLNIHDPPNMTAQQTWLGKTIDGQPWTPGTVIAHTRRMLHPHIRATHAFNSPNIIHGVWSEVTSSRAVSSTLLVALDYEPSCIAVIAASGFNHWGYTSNQVTHDLETSFRQIWAQNWPCNISYICDLESETLTIDDILES
jgi:hypothetical protein